MNSNEFLRIPRKSVSDPQYQYWTTIIAVAIAWQSTNILAIVSTNEYACRHVCIYIYMYSSSCPQLLLLLLLLLTATATAIATATSTATATATATVTAGALAISGLLVSVPIRS